MRVAVLGAAGRMGATVCDAVAGEEDLELVAAVDPKAAGRPLAEFCDVAGWDGLTIADSIDVLSDAGAEAAVDFTIAAAALGNLEWCAAHAVDAVCGTTGFSGEDYERLAATFADPAAAHCLIAPNFAISAVLMIRLAAIAAPFFPSVEIIELHHDQKRDAPSGTALATADAIAAARARAGSPELVPDPTETQSIAGTRGGRTAAGVPVHSVRLQGLVAHQEVIFGCPGQSLLIRQDSYDRSSFMLGVLMALRAVRRLPPFSIGLDNVLDL